MKNTRKYESLPNLTLPNRFHRQGIFLNSSQIIFLIRKFKFSYFMQETEMHTYIHKVVVHKFCLCNFFLYFTNQTPKKKKKKKSLMSFFQ